MAQPEEDGLIPEVISGSALMALESAEIDRQIATAKKWPRPEPAKILAKMKSYALLDEETAAGCFYVLKRKKTNNDGTEEETLIEGPSVRLAEIAFACFQNLRAGTRIIDNDGKTITSQGACMDLENNTAASTTVQRSILNRRGKTYSNDMQVTTGNAAQSIAFRNAVFKIVPMTLVRTVYLDCKSVAAGKGSVESRFSSAVKVFAAWGIKSAMLLSWLNKASVSDLADEDLISLRGLVTALRENETTIQAEFGNINADGTRKPEGPQANSDNMKAKADAMNGESKPTEAKPAESAAEQSKGEGAQQNKSAEETKETVQEEQQTIFPDNAKPGPVPVTSRPAGRPGPVRPINS